MAKMTTEQKIVNDALSAFLDVNADKKWQRHFGTWESIEWNEDATDKPSESDYLAQKETLEQNQRARLTRIYPSIQEQLDMQYWDNVNGTTTWKDAIAKVKADNPKS
tara:strand:+ start:657 stop:977 length:321 start_codon:yes stop_codon:yes gene_type:complete